MATFNPLIVTTGYPGYGKLDMISVANATVLDSIGSLPIQIQMDGNLVCGIGTAGVSIGMGTTAPTRQLDVASAGSDIARFYGSQNYSDNGVRITTDQSNSTAGVILEQRFADSVGGLRIDQSGNISIHAGASMDSQLSTATARLTILPLGMTGLGTTNPQNNLHVVGGIRTTGYSDFDPTPTVITTTGIAVQIDSWILTQYRTARYTIQVTNPLTANVDITELLMTHAHGVPYYTVIANTNNAGSLGTLAADTNGDIMQLTITNTISGIVVKVFATYITI